MSDFLTVVLVALLPAAGSIGGSLIAELWTMPRWAIGAALHLAMGVAIGLVSMEFMPRALDTTPIHTIALMFAAGAALSVLLSWTVRTINSGQGGGKWQVYSTTGADLFSDGLMTGATFAVSSDLGLLLGLSQVVGNLPGGFATSANFRMRGLDRRHRLFAAAFYVLPVLIGALLGFVLLRGAGAMEKNAVLALVAGVLLVTTVEELVPQADRPGTRRSISTSGFVAGFVFIVLLGSWTR